MALGGEGYWIIFCRMGKVSSIPVCQNRAKHYRRQSAVPQNTYYVPGIVPGPREAKK